MPSAVWAYGRDMRTLLVAAASFIVGCGPTTPRGMSVVTPRVSPDDDAFIELARATPGEGERVILAVYPRDPCTGSASAVVVDESGRFIGAVAPGTATLLRVPQRGQVLAFSSIDVTASEQAEPLVQEIDLRSVPDGLVFRTLRGPSMRSCSRNAGGQYMEAVASSKDALDAVLADKEPTFLEPDAAVGQAWLDAHRARLARIVGVAPPPRYLAHHRARVVYR